MKFARTALTAAIACLLAARPAPAVERIEESLADGPAVPILAWAGVPYDKASPERYAELAGAGFTHNYSGASDAATMQKVLDLAHAQGVKQFVSYPELESDPEAAVRRFKDHPGNGGYYLHDEPGASLFPKLAAWTKRIQSVDNVNPCYVNLLPTYGNPGMWGTPDYPKYVERFMAEVPTPMLSYDHYPIHREGKDASGDRVRGDFYYNLEVCSAAARKTGRPLWAFVLATAHNPYPIAEVSHMRLQAFSDLAYGAQAIQYFTYWTPKSTTWNFHQGPIEADGARTPTYDRVKQVNAEIQALRGAFIGSKLVSVGHTGAAIPTGTSRFSPVAPVTSLETEGTGAVVSLLENGKRRFLVVVNRDLHKPMPLNVSFEAAAGVKRAGRDGSLTPLGDAGHAAPVEPGDVAVFVWSMK
jgi:hypothetical protein